VLGMFSRLISMLECENNLSEIDKFQKHPQPSFYNKDFMDDNLLKFYFVTRGDS
jgi:hypothetical protein